MFAVYVLLIVIISFVAGQQGSCYFHDKTLPVAVYGHQAIFSVSKNAVYLFGGMSGTSWDDHSYPNKVFKWALSDPDSWFVEIGTTPTTSNWFDTWGVNAVLVNMLVFFIGMYHDDLGSGDMFVYDLNTESWLSDPKAPIPTPTQCGCLTTNGRYIFMVDGYDGSNGKNSKPRSPIIQVYDVATDTWQSQELTAGPPVKGGWYAQYCSLVGDGLYVMGGNTNWNDAEFVAGIYRIDTLTLQIEQLSATLPETLAHGVSVYNAHDQNFYLFGGLPIVGDFKQDILAFDLDALSVSTAFLSQQAYGSAPVLDLNGSFYRFGGRKKGSDLNYALDEVEICELPSNNQMNAPFSQSTQSPTKLPTMIPTTVSTDPTAVPTTHPYPTTVPSSTSTQTPTQSPSKVPSLIPTTVPSLISTPTNSSIGSTESSTPYLTTEQSDDPTNSPSSDLTVRPTTKLPTRPSPRPDDEEYGVETTIKIDAPLAQNETDELITALQEYAQKAANYTNCSERIDISSEIEEEKTVIALSMATCSEETEKQLLVAFDETVLVYDVINEIVAASDADGGVSDIEIEVEGIYSDSTANSHPPPHDDKKYWYLMLLALLVLVPAGVWFVWRKNNKKNQQKAAETNISVDANIVAKVEPVVELQQCNSEEEKGGMDSEQTAARVTASGALEEEGVDDLAEHKQPGAASYSRAEGNVAGALTGQVDDGNLVHVDVVNMNHGQVTAEGDHDDNDDAVEDNEQVIAGDESAASESYDAEELFEPMETVDENDDNDQPIVLKGQQQTVLVA